MEEIEKLLNRYFDITNMSATDMINIIKSEPYLLGQIKEKGIYPKIEHHHIKSDRNTKAYFNSSFCSY